MRLGITVTPDDRKNSAKAFEELMAKYPEDTEKFKFILDYTYNLSLLYDLWQQQALSWEGQLRENGISPKAI